MKQRKYIMLFGDTGSAVNELDDASAGRLFKAILRYADDREEVTLPGEEKLVYRMLLNQFARDEEAYRKRSERNKRYADKTPSDAFVMQDKEKEKDEDHDKDEEKDKDKDEEGEGIPARVSVEPPRPCAPPPPTPAPMIDPPSPEDVRAFCQEAGLQFDPARFCDYNAARGWMLGNRPMTDWKAAARVWASRGDQPVGSGASPPRPPRVLSQQAYTQREYTNSLDALDRMMARYMEETSSSTAPP